MGELVGVSLISLGGPAAKLGEIAWHSSDIGCTEVFIPAFLCDLVHFYMKAVMIFCILCEIVTCSIMAASFHDCF
jgi:hypothetical protein